MQQKHRSFCRQPHRRLVLRTEISPGVHRRVNLPECCVHDGQQVQPCELAWKCLELVLVGGVVDVQARPSQHGDFDCDFMALLWSKLLERFEGSSWDKPGTLS